MPRPNVTMSTDEVERYLSRGRNLQVATLGADGHPHLTTLWYTIRSGLIVFRSFSRSQRIVNLRRDPRITALLEDGDAYSTLRGVMVRGRAELSDDRQLILEISGAIMSKYELGGEPANPAAVEATFGRFATKNTAVIIHPEKTISWDHTKLQGRY